MKMTTNRQKTCGCDRAKPPTFNYPGVKPSICCSVCKLPGMENVYDKRCGCEKRCIKPVFNFPDKKTGTHCSVCKLPGMENVASKRCGCDKRTITPKFNFPGKFPGTHCVSCQLPGMEDVVHKRCGCERRVANPSFNYQDKKVGKCCDTCKLPGMINVTSKKCKCGTQVGFGFPGGKKECCVKFTRPGMVDLIHVSGLCKCGVRAGYGFPGGKKECCVKCKTEGMVDLAHVSDLCVCGVRANYGPPGGKLERCMICKHSGMIRLNKTTCDCGSPFTPIFSNDGGETRFCSKCRTPDMRNFVSRRCPGYNGVECPNGVICLYGYCAQCDPDDTRRTTHKRYEYAFFDYLKEYIKPKREHWIHTLNGLYRIDGIITNGKHILCIEVDEFGHKISGYEDDDIRQESITEKFLETYDTVAWVRVNPNCERKLMNDDYDAYLRIQEETQKSRHLLAKDAILHLVENPSSTTVLVY